VAPGRLGSGRKKKGKGKGRLTGGTQVSATRGKRKRREGEVGQRGCWPTGRWAERGAGKVFSFFFLFLFQTSFSNHFSFQIQIKLFQTFSQEFYKLFRNHTSNQKPWKPTDDAQTLVVSKFIKLYLIL
jgi:hypothetical protein